MIILRNISDGSYIEGQPSQIESIDAKKSSIKKCCSNSLILYFL